MTHTPNVKDYDADGQASYRQDFWENANRAYEDQAERIALEKLLQPPTGQRLLELGAGFGRLSEFYAGYEKVILVDYARSQLVDARSRLGDDKYIYVAADIYNLPFTDGACDAATMIRVIHHFEDAPRAIRQIRAAMADGGLFILEFANKRNLKAMLRFALGRQQWSPYEHHPVEFVELHFDFHPAYIQQELQGAGFTTKRRLPVSYFRLGFLKRLLPTSILVALDNLLQNTGWLYSPSIFTQNYAPGASSVPLNPTLFKCPSCKSETLREEHDTLVCEGCTAVWSKADGIYDFRQPIAP